MYSPDLGLHFYRLERYQVDTTEPRLRLAVALLLFCIVTWIPRLTWLNMTT